MTSVQQELNDFLQCELYHTLGSYGTTVKRLRELDQRVAHMRRRETDTVFEGVFPSAVITHTRRYNELLRKSLHRPTHPAESDQAEMEAVSRHPRPETRLDGEDVRNRWVLDFYRTAIHALEAYAQGHQGPDTEPFELGHILAIVDDPQRRGADLHMPATGRIARNDQRMNSARQILGLDFGRVRTPEILNDCLAVRDQDQLHTHTIGALVDAHMCMHQAEHLMAKSFGEKVKGGRDLAYEIEQELERSLMLNTFVYVIGRSVPWIFAADHDERRFVIEHYETCCDRLSPIYCTWIGNQLSLLALHRRAYTHMLMGSLTLAYNDFHKLRLFARNLKRQLGQSVAQAPGAEAFLIGLEAFAAHHSGRIYRSQNAHTTALRHFNRAASGLRELERDPALREMLRNSRWRVDLLMSQAKASYELGRMKRCLLSYARAWRAYLELADTESHARANYEIIDQVIRWLAEVEADSEIDKVELAREFAPLVEQFGLVRGPSHLRILAAELMMRVGHVLFILRLVDPDEGDMRRNSPLIPMGSRDTADTADADDDNYSRYPPVDHRLAYDCLLQAAQLDPASTLIAADLRKFEYWKEQLRDNEDQSPENQDQPLENGQTDVSDASVAIADQWPGGSGAFEEAARVVEYVLQCWLSESYSKVDRQTQPSEIIARRLLGAFLAHTDSSNVKLAQVYRYLMQESIHHRQFAGRQAEDDARELSLRDSGDDRRPGAAPQEPSSIELVCLRRYSSFFPFLPRPSTFRVLGGGYFARITYPQNKTFGIAVDPGPQFIDNLYRCGYCLDDVHMVIVTHDHADHIADLDALLALLGYRDKYDADRFTKERKLAIVGNQSVVDRYAFFNGPDRPDHVSVWTFSQWEQAARNGGKLVEPEKSFDELLTCPAIDLERVETVEHKDAAGNVAQGFLLKAGPPDARVCVLFTSDTGRAPSLEQEGAAREEMTPSGVPLARALAEADVVLAHLSSVHLSQLRELAHLGVAPAGAETQTEEFQALWSTLRRQIPAVESEQDDWARRQRFLMRQLQFGFHSPPRSQLKESGTKGLEVGPLSRPDQLIKQPSKGHLYLSGLLRIAEHISKLTDRPRLLLVGELREELGTFRTRVAAALNTDVFAHSRTTALTTDIGLKIRVEPAQTTVLCTKCDLDNDLVAVERYHPADHIQEVCVKGEEEGIFYNCRIHEPLVQPHPLWIERIERYDPFGIESLPDY